MALTVVYKGYTIQGRALPVLESGEWLAEAVVTFPRAAGSREQRVPTPMTGVFSPARTPKATR